MILYAIPPLIPAHDVADGNLAYTKRRREFVLRCFSGSILPTDFADLRFRQLGVWVVLAAWHTTMGLGVKRVLSTCDVFQVLRAVVCLVTVDVINAKSFRARRQKGLAYQDMHQMGCLDAIPRENEMRVASARRVLLADQPDSRKGARATTPHPPVAGYFVPAFKSDNGAPFFGGRARLELHRKAHPFGVMQPDGPNRRGCDHYIT